MDLEALLKLDRVFVKEFGRKTVGLVQLAPVLDAINGKMGWSVGIPDLRAFPVDVGYRSRIARRSYRSLVRDIDEPTVIMHRSSDPSEEPGRFLTAASIYDPRQKGASMHAAMNAMRRVRESGARAQLMQVLPCTLQNAVVDYERTSLDDDYPKSVTRLKCFGADSVAFYANSASTLTNNVDGEIAVLTRGLGTKIARGDEHVVMIMRSDHDVVAINLQHDYTMQSKAEYMPDTIDVISDETADMESIRMRLPTRGKHAARYDECHRTELPLDSRWGYKPAVFLDLVRAVADRIGSDVELEGIVTQKGISVVQMRTYTMPEAEGIALTELPRERLIHRTRNDSLGEINKKKWRHNRKGELSLGNARLEGRLVISKQVPEPSQDMILMYTGMDFDPDALSRYEQVVLPTFTKEGAGYPGQHAYGVTTQRLRALQERGVRALSLGRSFYVHFERRGIHEVPDVAVECADGYAQVFSTARAAGTE